MVEIPKGVWIWPLEIEHKYQLVHKEKEYLAGAPWFYYIMKFLELETYPNGIRKKEHC